MKNIHLKFYFRFKKKNQVVICNTFVPTTNGGGAGGTLLGIEVAEAVQTVSKVISGGKPLARQLLLAAGAQEAVLVPRLLAVGHTTSGDGLAKKNGKPLHTTVLCNHIYIWFFF